MGSLPAEAIEAEPFAAMRPLERAELAALRGGLFTPEGLEISFAVRLELDIKNKMHLRMRLNPRRELQVVLGQPGSGGKPPTALRRRENGSIEVKTGDGPPVPVGGDGRFELADGSGGSVVETPEGLVVSTDSGVPVSVDEGPQGLEVVVGDAETTFVRDQLGSGRFSAQVVNRQDDAAITHHAILDVNVHNFSQLAALRQVAAQIRRLQDLIGGALSLRGRP